MFVFVCLFVCLCVSQVITERVAEIARLVDDVQLLRGMHTQLEATIATLTEQLKSTTATKESLEVRVAVYVCSIVC